MSQPKAPPLSVRIPPDLLTRLEAWAQDNGKNRNNAIVEFIRAGLEPPCAQRRGESANRASLGEARGHHKLTVGTLVFTCSSGD